MLAIKLVSELELALNKRVNVYPPRAGAEALEHTTRAAEVESHHWAGCYKHSSLRRPCLPGYGLGLPSFSKTFVAQ